LTFTSVHLEQSVQTLDRARAARRLVYVDDDAVELHRSARDLEPPRHTILEARDDDVLVHAEHGVARPDHAGVRHMRRALREDARIRGRHVRVRADDGREATVEVPAHGDLLARGFGVPVEDAHPWRIPAQLIEKTVDRAERIVRRRHERATDRVHDEYVLDHDPTTSGIARREIDRPDREWEQLDVVEELPLVPDVVPVGDDVRAVGVELARDVGGESRAARGVLTIHDREVDAPILSDLRK
jgi:hypothetical protein